MEKITLKRNKITDKYTFGELWYKDMFLAYTLEDVIRDVKIYGETAIPYGTYQIIVNMSSRFKEQMPLLLNVPNFEGIRIHRGNFTTDTIGCILVGDIKTDISLINSTSAFNKVLKFINYLLKSGKVFIEIINDSPKIEIKPIISEPISNLSNSVELLQVTNKPVPVDSVEQIDPKHSFFYKLFIKLCKFFKNLSK